MALAVVAAGCGTATSTAPAEPTTAPAAGQAGDDGSSTGIDPTLDTLPPLHPAIDGLEETVVTLTTADGAVAVRAKVAAAAEDRARGLMEVTDLPDGAGMLFLFDDDRTGGFWMRNTVIALDIAFAGAQGRIHTTTTMTPCEAERAADCPVTSPAEPYRAALEVPAGWFDGAGVGPGATMTWTDPAPASG